MSYRDPTIERLTEDMEKLLRAGIFLRSCNLKGANATKDWRDIEYDQAVKLVPYLYSSRTYSRVLKKTPTMIVSEIAKRLGLPLPGNYRVVGLHHKHKVNHEQLALPTVPSAEDSIEPDVNVDVPCDVERQGIFRVSSPERKDNEAVEIVAVDMVGAIQKFQRLHPGEVVTSSTHKGTVWV